MIAATLRNSLARNDAQFAISLIARERNSVREQLEGDLRNHGIDSILDDARLLEALMESPRGAHASIALFTYVLIRNTLRALGEQDRMIADYLASLVVQFGDRGRAMRVADVDDEIYGTLAQLLAEVNVPDQRRAFLVRSHLGNYALWLSGLFPDHIEYRRWRRGGPSIDYYENLGRRGFELAAAHGLAPEYGVQSLYTTAAERFDLLRHALNDVSDRLLFPHRHSPERLLRQVRSTMGLRWSTGR